jgi:hypothetical protein
MACTGYPVLLACTPGNPAMTDRCGYSFCSHAAHRSACKGKYPSGCVPLEGSGFACYRRGRAPCICPWRTCRCGTLTAVAGCKGEPEFEETIARGSDSDPAGTLAIRQLVSGRAPGPAAATRRPAGGRRVAGGGS